MCFYLRQVGSLARNLLWRLWTELKDSLVLTKRRLLYRLRVSRYDDVGPDYPRCQELLPPLHHHDLGAELENHTWYHNVDRKTAETLVLTGGEGCFLIRKSVTYPLTLTVFHQNKSFNIPIRKREDCRIALGSRKQNERTFDSVEEMVSFYTKEELILFSGGEKAGNVVFTLPPSQGEIERLRRNTCHHIMVHVPQILRLAMSKVFLWEFKFGDCCFSKTVPFVKQVLGYPVSHRDTFYFYFIEYPHCSSYPQRGTMSHQIPPSGLTTSIISWQVSNKDVGKSLMKK